MIYYSRLIKTIVGALLAVIVFSVGLLGPISMAKAMNQCSACAVQTSHSTACDLPAGGGLCYQFHQGIINSLSNSLPANLKLLILVWSIGALFFMGRYLGREKWVVKIRLRFKQLIILASQIWQKQFGQWLSLREQKSDTNLTLTLVHSYS